MNLGRQLEFADAHGYDGKRFVVRAEEKLTAFLAQASELGLAETILFLPLLARVGDHRETPQSPAPRAYAWEICRKASGHTAFACVEILERL